MASVRSVKKTQLYKGKKKWSAAVSDRGRVPNEGLTKPAVTRRTTKAGLPSRWPSNNTVKKDTTFGKYSPRIRAKAEDHGFKCAQGERLPKEKFEVRAIFGGGKTYERTNTSKNKKRAASGRGSERPKRAFKYTCSRNDRKKENVTSFWGRASLEGGGKSFFSRQFTRNEGFRRLCQQHDQELKKEVGLQREFRSELAVCGGRKRDLRVRK